MASVNWIYLDFFFTTHMIKKKKVFQTCMIITIMWRLRHIITLDNHKLVVKLTITDVTDNNSYDNEKVAY